MKSLDALKSRPVLASAIIALIIFLASVVIVCPFFLSHPVQTPKGVALKLVNTHDLVQHLAVMQDFDKVLKSGNLYPRWLPDYNNGYGGPWMNYYPPGFYYVASLANLVFNDWIYTLFAVSILGLSASGLAFYILAREFYSRFASLAAALVYMLLPYHVINLYWQGAMPQFLGFVFLPLVLLFAYRLGARGRFSDYGALGLTYGLYLLTHAPVSFLMTYTVAFYTLVWAIKARDWKILLRVGLGMALGLMVGAIYWLPAALETKYIQEHFSALFPYHQSYITLLPLEGFGNLINLSFITQTIIIIVAILALRTVAKPASGHPVTIEAAHNGKETRLTSRTQTGLWIMLAIATTFMTTSFSIFISKLLPRIQVATFAWRWLAISGLFTSLLASAAIDHVRGRIKLAPTWAWIYRAAIASAIVLAVWVTANSVMAGALSNPIMEPPSNYADPGFTPSGSTNPQTMPDTALAVITPENGATRVMEWEPGSRQLLVSVEQPSRLRLRTYNFPGWVARIDEQPAPISSDKDGAQVIEILPGRHTVEVQFVSTPTRKLGAAFSLMGLALIAGLMLTPSIVLRKQKGASEKEKEPEAGQMAAEAKGPALSRRSVGIALGVAAMLIVIVLIAWLARRPSAALQSNNQTSAQESFAAPGDRRLYIQGRSAILVAVDGGALDQLIATLSKRDNQAVDSMVAEGKLFSVAPGTKVRMLESESGKIKVRILEGDSALKEGWVPEIWLR